MNQELQLGKHEFYPNDRQLLQELLFEIRELRRQLRKAKDSQEIADDVLEEWYRQLAEAEKAAPAYLNWAEN